MHHRRFLLAALLMSVPATAVAEPPSPAPTTLPSFPLLSGPRAVPVELFNGKDLSDWMQVIKTPPTTQPATAKENTTWSVRNGVIHSTGAPTGYIRTSQQTMENFVLTVQQRHLKAGNGGVLFAVNEPDKVWPRELEVQGQTGDEGDLRNIDSYDLTPDPARTQGRRLKKIGPISEKPVGEWETIEVIVDHGNLTVLVNGQLQNTATYRGTLRGFIGLQAEGAEMEFRKVEMSAIVAR